MMDPLCLKTDRRPPVATALGVTRIVEPRQVVGHLRQLAAVKFGVSAALRPVGRAGVGALRRSRLGTTAGRGAGLHKDAKTATR